MTTRSPERGFSNSITLALDLAQPHYANITNCGRLDTIYDITLAIYLNSTLYAYFKPVYYHQSYIIVQMPSANFESPKPKLVYLPVKQIATYNASQRPYEKIFIYSYAKMVGRYDTPQFLLKSAVRLFCNGTGRYVGTLFELAY